MMVLFIYPLWIFFARTIDRFGKGIRTGARDAILSDEATRETKGKVFYNLIFAFFAFPMGIIADYIGLKTVFIIGLFLFAAVYFGMAVSTNVYSIFGLFILYGIYASATDGISKAWISNISDKKGTATAIDTFSGLQSICAMLASTLTGLIWYEYGAATTFTIIALATVHIFIYFLTIPYGKELSDGVVLTPNE